MTNTTTFNRLKDEKSAYLLQHKENPVHWWNYGPEALLFAKEQNLPIFLSIGYSSCHWCHVMAHESFQDEVTAQYLNENFVCIKIDREELPDLDNYYQAACHLFTNGGGWPLSAFTLPDMRPFFVGTYFPKNARNGETSFMELLKELKRAYTEEHDKVEENASRVTETIEKGMVSNEKVDFSGHFPAPMSVLEALKQFRDEEFGGHGNPPKFPQFAFYEWALEQMLEGMVTKEHGDHVVKTMESILLGGICDHARGGIHRYSTDEKWLVPHFEKMLYDQAGFLKTLSKLSLIYGSPLVYDAIFNTLDYLENEMLGENNIFFSAQDADSEGVEGLYFTYTKEEFEDVLNANDDENESFAKNRENILKWFQISEEGNFENKLNVISLAKDHLEEIYTQDGWDLVRKVRQALLKDRKERIPPVTDSKGIAGWNFMMVTALVDVMQYCRIEAIRNRASTLFNRVIEGVYKEFLVAKDGEGMKIRHVTTKEGTLPYFEDYVFFSEAMLRVYEITGNPVFKDNFKDTFSFIAKEFSEGQYFKTRAIATNDFELYPNQNFSNFDTSFKSAAATMILLSRRASILFMDKELEDQFRDIAEQMTHEVLKNPLGSGEALRALTYPKEAYRVIKIPREWAKEARFINFIPYFMSRFVLDYVEGSDDRFEICAMGQCELAGSGIEEFIQALTPANEQSSVQE